jgi:hypothetical protein
MFSVVRNSAPYERIESGGEKMKFLSSWSLSKLIVLVLLGGLLMLLIDIRWEHRVELGRQWETWIPLIYIGVMLIIGVLSLSKWEGWGPRLLQAGFALGIIVGLLGVWFHGGRDPIGNVLRVFKAWAIPLGTNGGVKVSSEPPVIAPLAFVGLGLLGLLACARRFRAR